MLVRQFEDLEAWIAARNLVQEIYRVTSKGGFAKDYGLRDQIRRAAVSVMSNIAEGFERGSRREFIQFLIIARGSLAEVRSQLYVALDLEYLDQASFDRLSGQASRTAKLVNGFVSYLRNRAELNERTGQHA